MISLRIFLQIFHKGTIFSINFFFFQIKGFFDDVTNLLLTDVKMMYPEDRVSFLTSSEFETFPSGTELVVAGSFLKELDSNSNLDLIPVKVDLDVEYVLQSRLGLRPSPH